MLSKKTLSTLLKLLAGLAILALVFWKMDIRAALVLLADTRPGWLALGLGLGFVAVLMEALRLRLLMGAYGLAYGEALRITYFVLLFGILLPGGVGGEAYKVYRLKTISQRWSVGVSMLFVDRLLGVTSLALITTVSSLLAGVAADLGSRLGEQAGAAQGGRLLPWLAAGAALLSVGLFFASRHPRVRVFLAHCVENIKLLPRRVLLTVFAIAGMNFLLRALALYSFVQALSAQVSYVHAILVCGITYLSDLLPISVGSIGVWEGVITFSLSVVGLAASTALAVAILGRISFLVQFFVALGLWFGSREKHRMADEA